MRDYVTHLRLPFQFLLSPIFLWGYLLASTGLTWALLEAYLALHLFGYAGGTALNSAYDRDEGPIGGLAAPPPVPPRLLEFSIAWQGLGLVLALAVNPILAAIYAVMFCLSLAYSHPLTRWKGRPRRALLTVALGQGLLPFLAGWAVARGEIGSAASNIGLAGALTVMLITVGFYPLTQIYQLDADARRGDLTLARYLGVTGSFRFAAVCLTLGALGGMYVAAVRFTSVEALALAALIAALLAWLRRWALTFLARTILENFRTAMRMYAAATLPFLAWIVFRLVIPPKG